MVKALFHKNQRVYVKPVGTWALVERVVPYWTKGLHEPLRIHYDVGMGREFSSEDLQAEKTSEILDGEGEAWRVRRVPNKWQSVTETAGHPFPGTCPVIVTGEAEWGGWRVSGAEYALSATRIERQARVIVSAPRMADIIKQLTIWALQAPADAIPEALLEPVRRSRELVDYLEDENE